LGSDSHPSAEETPRRSVTSTVFEYIEKEGVRFLMTTVSAAVYGW